MLSPEGLCFLCPGYVTDHQNTRMPSQISQFSPNYPGWLPCDCAPPSQAGTRSAGGGDERTRPQHPPGPGRVSSRAEREEREERGQKPAVGGYTVILSYNNVTEEFSPRLNIVVYECLHISKIKVKRIHKWSTPLIQTPLIFSLLSWIVK